MHLQVNIVVVAITFVVMIALVILSFYKSPMTSLIGAGVFALGLPLYGLILLLRDNPTVGKGSGKYHAVRSAQNYRSTAIITLLISVYQLTLYPQRGLQ